MASHSSDRTTKRLYKKLSKRLLKDVGDQLEARLLAPHLDVIAQQTTLEFTDSQHRRVKLLAIGPDEAVLTLIHTLQNLGFAEAIAWSLPLDIGQGRIELQLEPGEIARILSWRKERRSVKPIN